MKKALALILVLSAVSVAAQQRPGNGPGRNPQPQPAPRNPQPAPRNPQPQPQPRNPRNPMPAPSVTASCTYGLVNNMNGMVMRQFTQTSVGPNYNAARSLACQQAMFSCQSAQAFNSHCIELY